MGTRDSSKTRVVPVFDELLNRAPDGWVARLLNLPRGGRRTVDEITFDARVEEAAWGEEKQLKPPLSLLEWLVSSADLQPGCLWGTSPATIDRRKRLLLNRDPELVAEARARLTRPLQTLRSWYVFEGPSCPDAYIQTPDAIIVVEGKRTEHGPTRHTSWMPVRHQMLRHLDGAMEICDSRNVFGFFIVEGIGGSAAVDVPTEWISAAAATVSEEVLSSSLPHRSGAEKEKIANAFMGVTTWQRVCQEFDIAFDRLPDIVDA